MRRVEQQIGSRIDREHKQILLDYLMASGGEMSITGNMIQSVLNLAGSGNYDEIKRKIAVMSMDVPDSQLYRRYFQYIPTHLKPPLYMYLEDYPSGVVELAIKLYGADANRWPGRLRDAYQRSIERDPAEAEEAARRNSAFGFKQPNYFKDGQWVVARGGDLRDLQSKSKVLHELRSGEVGLDGKRAITNSERLRNKVNFAKREAELLIRPYIKSTIEFMVDNSLGGKLISLHPDGKRLLENAPDQLAAFIGDQIVSLAPSIRAENLAAELMTMFDGKETPSNRWGAFANFIFDVGTTAIGASVGKKASVKISKTIFETALGQRASVVFDEFYNAIKSKKTELIEKAISRLPIDEAQKDLLKTRWANTVKRSTGKFETYDIKSMSGQYKAVHGYDPSAEDLTSMLDYSSKISNLAEQAKRKNRELLNQSQSTLARIREVYIEPGAARKVADSDYYTAIRKFKELPNVEKYALERLAMGATIVARHIDEGARTFADIVSRLKKDMPNLDEAAYNNITSKGIAAYHEASKGKKSLSEVFSTSSRWREVDVPLRQYEAKLATAKMDADKWLKDQKVLADFRSSSNANKIFQELFGVLKMPSMYKNMTDFLKPARQNLGALLLHPNLSSKAYRVWLEAGFGANSKNAARASVRISAEEAYTKWASIVKNNPHYNEMIEVGLSLPNRESFTEISSVLRPELWSQKVMDKGIGMNLRNYSERVQSIVPAVVRSEMYKTYVDYAKSAGKVMSKDEKIALANFINYVTGQGGLSSRAVNNLSLGLLSPRSVESAFGLALGKPLIQSISKTGLKSTSTKIIATSYAKLLGTVSTLTGLMKMAGVDVETDPASKNFLKIKVMGKYLDFFGKLQEPVRVLYQAATARQLKDGQKVSIDRKKVVSNYFLDKLNPAAQVAAQSATNERESGARYTVSGALRDVFTPKAFETYYTPKAPPVEGKSNTSKLQGPVMPGTNGYRSNGQTSGTNKPSAAIINKNMKDSNKKK